MLSTHVSTLACGLCRHLDHEVGSDPPQLVCPGSPGSGRKAGILPGPLTLPTPSHSPRSRPAPT